MLSAREEASVIQAKIWVTQSAPKANSGLVGSPTGSCVTKGFGWVTQPVSWVTQWKGLDHARVEIS